VASTAVARAPVVPQATEASVKDHRQLTRHINDISAAVSALSASTSRLPIGAGRILSVAMTAGTTAYVAHGLGRPYQGFVVVRTPPGASPVLRQTFTASGTYTAPPNCTQLAVEGCGGGGGGAGGSNGSTGTGFQAFGGSGGGGACKSSSVLTITSGATISVTIGAGGAGGANGANGSDGGTTSFGSLASWSGGGGGVCNTTHTSAFAAAVPGGANIATAPLSFAISSGNVISGPIFSPHGFGGWSIASGNGNVASTSGAPSIEGHGGTGAGAIGSSSGTTRGGGCGAGGGGGPYGASPSGGGGNGGFGNGAGSGANGTRPDATANTVPMPATTNGTGGGGAGGGAGGHGSTAGGNGGGGAGGDCGRIVISALLPSLVCEQALKTGQSNTQYIALIAAIAGTYQILVY
jgi:hypothetical protein